MNRTIFTGRTTKDIELTHSKDKNTVIAKFSLAVDSGYKDRKKTNFFSMVAFGKTAETLEKYVHKGTKILVECQANQNQYTNRNGDKISTVDFTVQNFEFCESKNANQNQSNQAQEAQGQLPPMPGTGSSDFLTIPDSISEEDLPWS